MALINGNDYDHIDFTKNGVTTRHMLKDTLSRQMSGDLVKVQNEEPTSEGTKIWIKPSGDSEVQVPTYEEFEELSDRVDSINTMSIHICTAQEYNSETGVPTVSNPDAKTFYLVPGGDAPNLYVEWIFTDSRWEQFGSATIDLSNYATKDEIPDVPVEDVQIAGVSVLQDGVANVPVASYKNYGVVKPSAGSSGIVSSSSNILTIYNASPSDVKNGTDGYKPLTSNRANAATFYGLAKAAGHDEKDSALPTGQYTEEAKDAINEMLGVEDRASAVIENTASGSIVSFADGAKDRPVDKLTVKIEPIQDLHGYDNPWPAGGGANKWPVPNMSFSLYSTSLNRAEYPEIYAAMEKLTPGSIYRCGSAGTGENVLAAINLYYSDRTIAIRPTNMTGGEIPDLSDGTITLNTVQMQVGTATNVAKECREIRVIKTTTSNPAYVPYENICPITGLDGVKVTRTGKNLLDPSILFASENNIRTRTGEYVRLKKNVEYYYCSTIPIDGLYIDDKSNNNLALIYNNQCLKYTPTEDIEVALNAYWASGKLPSGGLLVDMIYLCVGSDSGYEPYAGNTYDITFPTEAGTVYGGELDLTTDVLTVTYNSVLLGDLQSWGSNSTLTTGVMRALVNGIEVPLSQNTTTAKMDRRKAKAWSPLNAIDSDCFGISPTGQVVIPIGKAVNSVEDFLSEYGDAQLVYPLATPITYALTPTEICTLLGQNHIWSDTGDAEVRYRANTKLYIDTNRPEVPVKDVQVNGASILQDGVVNIPAASPTTRGVVIVDSGRGIITDATPAGRLSIVAASSYEAKTGIQQYRPITPVRQHESTFYGLAKAAGDTTQSASSNAVGQYTDEAKEAIAKMLGLRLWHEAYIDVNDYDSTLGMFIFDAGEGNEVKDIRVNGQVVWDTAIAANSYIGVGVGNTTNRKNYSDFAQYSIPASANRVSIAADGYMIDPIDSYRCCMGYGFLGFSSNAGHVLNVDISCKAQMTGSQTCVYHNFNDPRYVHIVAPDNPSWASIKVEYTLK